MIRICEAQTASANKTQKYTQTEQTARNTGGLTDWFTRTLLWHRVTVNCWNISATWLIMSHIPSVQPIQRRHSDDLFISSHALRPLYRSRSSLLSSSLNAIVIQFCELIVSSVAITCLFLFSVKALKWDKLRCAWKENCDVMIVVLDRFLLNPWVLLNHWPHAGNGRYYETGGAGNKSAIAAYLSQRRISKHHMLLLTFPSPLELSQHNN